MISQVRHLLSYILNLSRNSNVIVINRPNLGWYRFGLRIDLCFIVGKSRCKLCSTMVLVLVGIDITSTALTKLHSILIKKFQYMVATRPNLGWYRSGLIANFVFIVFKGRHQLCSRVLVLVGIDITSTALTKLHSILIKKFQCNGYNYTNFGLIQIWSCCGPFVHCIEK
jgi:hypothetical protein